MGPVTGDSCNATERVRSQLKICERQHGHVERTHKDGEHEWPVEGYAGEREVQA